MKKNVYIAEVLTSVHNAPDNNEKARILKSNETVGLLHVLRHAFCPWVEFDCGIPEYNPSVKPLGTDYANLQAEARRLYIFRKDTTKLTLHRKREILLQLLESIHASEARLLCQVLKKDVKVNGLTAELVDQVFPGLLDWKEGNTVKRFKDLPKAVAVGETESTATENMFDEPDAPAAAEVAKVVTRPSPKSPPVAKGKRTIL